MSPKVYNLDEFNDKAVLYRQHLAYLLNITSAQTFLDYSNNKEEVQNAVKRVLLYKRSCKKNIHRP